MIGVKDWVLTPQNTIISKIIIMKNNNNGESRNKALVH